MADKFIEVRSVSGREGYILSRAKTESRMTGDTRIQCWREKLRRRSGTGNGKRENMKEVWILNQGRTEEVRKITIPGENCEGSTVRMGREGWEEERWRGVYNIMMLGVMK